MPAERNESVERAISLLQSFTRQKNRLSLAELARETGLHKSTILRLTKSLQLYGFMNRDPDGRFSLGASVWQLGAVFRAGFNCGEDIRPILRRLARQTGESASFFVRAGKDRVCLYREQGDDMKRFGIEEGMRFSLTTGAAGLVIRHVMGDVLSNEERAMLDAKGFANVPASRNPYIASVAAPLFDRRNEFKGALTISGVLPRFDIAARDKALLLLETATEDLRNIVI